MTNKERRNVRLGYLADDGITPRIDDGPSNLNVICPPRWGKLTRLMAIIGLTFDGSLIYSDPKGQGPCIFAHHRKYNMGHDVYSLNPMQKHLHLLQGIEDVGFNPMQGLNPDDLTWAEECGQLAEGTMLRGKGGDDNAMHFSETAQALIAGTIAGVSYLDDYSEDQKNLVTVYDIIASSSEFFEFADKMLESKNDYLVSCFGRFDSASFRDSKETDSILSSMRSQSAWIGGHAMRRSLSRNMPFRLAEMKERAITLCLTMPLIYHGTLERWSRIFFVRAVKELGEPKKDAVPVLFVADEVKSTLSRLSIYPDFLSYSAGVGVRVMSVWQDANQIVTAFPHSWQSVLACAGTQIYGRPRDNFTASHLSEALGETEVITRSQSVNYTSDLDWDNIPALRAPQVSESKGQAARRLMLPQELRQLPEDRMIILSENYRNPLLGVARPYFKSDEFKGQYGPDPYEFDETIKPPGPRGQKNSKAFLFGSGRGA